MKNISIAAYVVSVITILIIVVSFGAVDVIHAEDVPICPLEVLDENQYVIDFEEDGGTYKGIIASGGYEDATVGPVVAGTPAGIYYVVLTSWDSHEVLQVQNYEQWQIEFLNSSNKIIAISDPSEDISDDETYSTDVVNLELVVPEDVASVRAIHAEYPNENPESVVPVCAKFEIEPKPDIDQDPATITVVKTVINNDGGTAEISDFNLFVDDIQVISGEKNEFVPGTYVVSEQNISGYTAGDWGGDCSFAGVVSIEKGEEKICTITNNDNDQVINPAYLTLIKNVENDDGGVADVDDFDLFVGDTHVISGEKNKFEQGIYVVSESNLPGYDAGVWGGDCESDGTIKLDDGDDKVCTITNDDIFIPPTKARLTLIKEVINNNGGTAEPNDFNLSIYTIPVSDPIVVSSGEAVVLPAGEYVVSEDSKLEYNAGTWGGDCDPLGDLSGTVTLKPGESKICRITNDDIPQVEGANVYINKSVTPSEKSLNDTKTPFTYTLNYGNNGDINSNDVSISDTPSPTDILHAYEIVSGPDHGTCESLENGIICDIGTLDQGEVGVITYVAYVIGDKSGVVNNIATITTSADEITLEDNTDTADIAVGLSDVIDVSIEKIVDGAEFSSGAIATSFTYTLTYRNIGQLPAENVEFFDILQATGTVEIIEITKQADHNKPMDPTPCNITGGGIGVTCLLGTLEPGVVGTVIYVADGIALGTVDNIVEISADNEGSDVLGNNIDDARVTITGNSPQADVAITKSVDPTGTQDVSRIYNFTLVYKNIGNIDAENVTIDDEPDVKGILTSFSITGGPDHGTCVVKDDNKGLTCDVGTLKPGESGTVLYKATGVKEGVVINTARIATITGESDLLNNEDTAKVELDAGGGGGGGCSNCGGGGGRPKPKTFLFTGEVAGASVLLSSVPYTGAGDVVQMILFFVVLAGIAGFLTYGVFRYRSLRKEVSSDNLDRATRNAEESMTLNSVFASEKSDIEKPAYSPNIISNVDFAPISETKNDNVLEQKINLQEIDQISQMLNHKAQDLRVLMSADARQAVVNASRGNASEATKMFEQAVKESEKRFSREDGWLLLNKTRIEEVLFTTKLSNIPLFVQWIINGDEKQIFSFLRKLSQEGNDTSSFIREVVTSLDGVYQARLDGVETNVDPSVTDLVGNISREDLESIITNLTRGIDGGYTSVLDGVKVAVMRIIGEKSERIQKTNNMAVDISDDSHVGSKRELN